jgi:hypothetical protein
MMITLKEMRWKADGRYKKFAQNFRRKFFPWEALV